MRNKIIPYNIHLKDFARTLRKKPTEAEAILWTFIRRKNLGVEFHRQVPMLHYIADFYCHEIMLAIELDGGYHKQVNMQFKDKEMEDNLSRYEVEVIRFTNEEVLGDLPKVLKVIEERVADKLKYR